MVRDWLVGVPGCLDSWLVATAAAGYWKVGRTWLSWSRSAARLYRGWSHCTHTQHTNNIETNGAYFRRDTLGLALRRAAHQFCTEEERGETRRNLCPIRINSALPPRDDKSVGCSLFREIPRVGPRLQKQQLVTEIDCESRGLVWRRQEEHVRIGAGRCHKKAW